MSSLNLSLIRENFSGYWQELEKPAVETGLKPEEVKKCYEFAYRAHLGQKRESGEEYITHPVWVARVVIQLGIGHKSVFAALLHDCIEDTSVTLDDIAKEFGDETALLVEGLTEVKKKTHGIEVHQTSIEIFRKFLFSSVNDVRVLIIRLVDKLHNGLTIKYLSRQRQVKYAHRVLGIYSPVAEYVGLHYFKRILDDIAFEILNPEEVAKLRNYFRKNKKHENRALATVIEDINEILKMNRLNGIEVEGRIKSLFSTYQKIKKKGADRIKDRVGVRVITRKIDECYTILGLLHAKYPYLQDEFNDYISDPKPNGYRSIQTTLDWRGKTTVEVQIRTREMHEFNEFGPASHVVYKMNKGESDGVGIEWARDLVKWQTGSEKIKNYQIDVLKKYIYVFTPKGDTIQLPTGSTALDFAYRIHGDLGNCCRGAKVNQKMAKINTVLKTGDVVEIIAGKNKNVNRDWIDWVITGFAKSHIRRETQNDL